MAKNDRLSVDAALAARLLDQLIARLGGRRQGAGAICHCPAHPDRTPSLSIRIGDRRLLFKCFAGCETTDVLSALREMRIDTYGSFHSGRRRDPSASDAHEAARRLWAGGREVAGTLAETYLASRGLFAPHLAARFHSRTPLGRGSARQLHPALLVAVCDHRGLVAVQRLFLDPSTGHKRAMDAPRRTLGRMDGGAVRLGSPGATLALAEGYETARAAAAALEITVWATLGAERLHRITVPENVETILLLPDRDAAGLRAARRATDAYRAQGFAVAVRWPPDGAIDWADVMHSVPV